MRFLAAFFALVFSPFSIGLCAQTGIPEDKAAFTVISLKEGLVNSSVSGIVQDSKGFIWLATQGGLCRYDGQGFKSYENQPFDENSISGDLIQTMFRDPDDMLWIGTYSGLNRLDLSTERFLRYRYSADDAASLSNDLVIAIGRDARGALWVGTLNGLNRLDEATGRFTRYFHDDKDPYSLPDNTVRSLFRDSKGRFWIGTTGGGFARYDYDRDRFENCTAVQVEGKAAATEGMGKIPPSASLQSIAEDSEGRLWLGAWGIGLLRYSPSDGSWRTWSLPDNRIYVVNTQEAGIVRVGTWGGGLHILDPGTGALGSYRNSKSLGALPNDVVYSMLQDSSGELWIGTNGGGLARLDRTRKSFTAYVSEPNKPDSLPYGKIIASLVDRRGQLWVSVYSNGISRYDASSGSWRTFRHSDKDPKSLGDDTCNWLYEDHDGTMWVCTNAGLSRFNPATSDFTTVRHLKDNPDSPSSDIFYSLIEDRSGNFWIGTYTTGLDFWDRSTGHWRHYAFSPDNPDSISDNLVNSLVFDTDGRLWIGTNNGLNRFEDGKFIRYYYSPDNKAGISNSSILRLMVDSRGTLWVPTRGGGLNRYYPRTDSFTHYLRKDGLPANVVYTVLEDKNGNLWIVTQSGIALYDSQSGILKHVALYRDLENASFNNGSSRSASGDLYFGSLGMLVKFDPNRYDFNTHVPPVYITSFLAANQPKIASPVTKAPSIPLNLANWQNSIEVRFAALDFRNPEANQFSFKLEGFDKDWTFSGSRNFATYTNLPGGRYVFRVRAANNDGLWNSTGASIPFSVQASPFASPLAFALYLLGLLFAGYSVAKIRANRVLALKVKALTEADDALKAEGQRSEKLAEEAKRANDAKSEFIATISHEIRTPLNGVLGMTELLSRTRLDPSQAEYVGTIERSGETLLALINGVLDFSKLEAARVTLETIPFDLDALVRKSMASFAHPASKKGLGLEATVAEGLSGCYYGDPLRLGQVLANLLSNAIKFTHQGQVMLGVERVEGSAAIGESVQLRFSVKDTGIGIKEESLADLFMPFSQADQSTTRRFGGTGLGLSISKRYIELMGGTLGVESVFGKGSVFSFVIALAVAPAESLKDNDYSPSRIADGLSILVVDDDDVNRLVAVHLLEEMGARPVEAESGHAAIAELGRRHFDLVLLDCLMPGMDGFETARRLRDPASGARNPHLPIVALTAKVQEEDRIRCLEAGMNGFVAKPLSFRGLEKMLAGIFPSRGGGPALQAPRAGLQELGGMVFDEKDFASRYAGAPELGTEILGLYLAQARPLLEESRASFDGGVLAEAADMAHRLKGSSGAIGAERVARLAGMVEISCREGGRIEGGLAESGRESIAGLYAALDSELNALEETLVGYVKRT